MLEGEEREGPRKKWVMGSFMCWHTVGERDREEAEERERELHRRPGAKGKPSSRKRLAMPMGWLIYLSGLQLMGTRIWEVIPFASLTVCQDKECTEKNGRSAAAHTTRSWPRRPQSSRRHSNEPA